MSEYAYIRVSTKEQNVDRQLMELEKFHLPKKNIYCDHQSGKDFNRPAYQKLMKKLKPGDLLIIKRCNRKNSQPLVYRQWLRCVKSY